jgi:hypothetical protein
VAGELQHADKCGGECSTDVLKIKEKCGMLKEIEKIYNYK